MVGEKILGIEGGGTKTAWALISGDKIVESGKLPGSNFRLTPSEQITRIFRNLPAQIDRVGVFLAGCATKEDRAVLLHLARAVWPKAKIIAGSDRDSGMAACLRDRDGIAVNAGTGSSVTGRTGSRIENAGGWGHILGDAGGAYFVSARALRSILREYDLRRGERKFAANILRTLGLNNFDELVRWAQTAEKMEIASLAPVVFEAARKNDETARQIIATGVSALVDFTTAVSLRLGLDAPEVRLMGGLFEHQESYSAAFATALIEKLPEAKVSPCGAPPEVGAAWLAAEDKLSVEIAEEEAAASEPVASTEMPNLNSLNLDQLSAPEIVELFVAEERFVQQALQQSRKRLAQAIELSAKAITNGGRIIYVGAGSSGRLGVLDAAEIPPTFGAPADLFQGIIAGGAFAVWRSIEGAEDDARGGALAIDERGIISQDVVIGISASGRAPFVIAALRRSQELGARTILLTCDPSQTSCVEATVMATKSSDIVSSPEPVLVDMILDLRVGPEILAGSTRLKAGTATKVALNIISTGAMARLGRVRGNLMIDLRATNKKLRTRAIGIVSQLAGCDRKSARSRLERTDWNLRAALEQDPVDRRTTGF